MPDRSRMHGLPEELNPVQQEQEAEGWLISYLDVLTLLITLFVLLLTLTEHGKGDETHQQAATDVMPGQPQNTLPLHHGLLPRYDGLQHDIRALALSGVEASQSQEGVTLRIADHLLFASGQAALTPEGKEVIRKLLAVLNRFDGNISVEGHSDVLPIHTRRFASNWELSSGRAISVLHFLEQEQIAAHRLRAIGYADTRPLAGNETPEGRATNRRVELVLHEH
jgi:chemotaxis protein MotB